MKILLLALLLLQDARRPEFASVTGQIRSVDGSVAAGIRVAAMVLDENGTANPNSASLASLAQTDNEGRYNLQNVPPGRYLIAAGLLDSPSYFPGVKTAEEARSITVAAGENVVRVDFMLARPGGVRVRGRITNYPRSAPAGLFTVILVPVNGPGTLYPNAEVASDGTFEFPRAQPGSYDLRLDVLGTQPRRIEIREKDIEGVQLAPGPLVFGRVTIDDGSLLPAQGAGIAAGRSDPPSMLRLQPTRDGRVTAGTGVVRRSGMFFMTFREPGEYMVVPTMLPLGYDVKSMTYGAVNLLNSPLKAETGPASTEVLVTLTRKRPPDGPSGVKVSGRVAGLESAPGGAPVFVTITSAMPATNQLSTTRIAEASVRPDGTFEITGVPPGRYQMRTTLPVGQVIQVDVSTGDVNGIELTMRNSANP